MRIGLFSRGGAAPTPSGEVHLVGVLRIPKPERGNGKKIFSGVLIEPDGSPSWVASYESDGLWAAFDGRRVEIVGERYEPKDQALVAPHVRVKTLSLEHSDPNASMTRFGEEQTMQGKLVEYVWPEGTALAGEKWVRFVTTEGREFFLASKRPAVPLDQPMTVRARIVEPSPYSARPGGEYVWIYEAR